MIHQEGAGNGNHQTLATYPGLHGQRPGSLARSNLYHCPATALSSFDGTKPVGFRGIALTSHPLPSTFPENENRPT